MKARTKKMVKRMNTNNSKIILNGIIRRNSKLSKSNTIVLTFYCKPILDLCKTRKISAKAIFNTSLTEVVIKPAKTRTIIFVNYKYAVSLAVTKYLPNTISLKSKETRKIKVIVLPKDFGLNIKDFIDDQDGRRLAYSLEKVGFLVHPIRSTSNNRLGDLITVYQNKLFTFHISRYCPNLKDNKNKLKFAYFLIGKLIFQCFKTNEIIDTKNILVLNQKLLTNGTLDNSFVKFLHDCNTTPIFVNFAQNWEEEVLNYLKKEMLVGGFSGH